MTRFGMKERDFGELAEIMKDLIRNRRPAGEAVTRLRSRFTRMHYCLPEKDAKALILELVGASL